ncbi:hypothetical protein BT67DRAFT_98955 [Trichocladium antarcticum]|uniref:Uncharacterized protein n=1 Tax=Trichocladium antarcticum TaxID=1450529 RepID=A0AAN6UQ97_9PEZI|nr:hypothetical protein BT67DRAFT_98955 [Trichocladium antarcticum]
MAAPRSPARRPFCRWHHCVLGGFFASSINVSGRQASSSAGWDVWGATPVTGFETGQPRSSLARLYPFEFYSRMQGGWPGSPSLAHSTFSTERVFLGIRAKRYLI